MEAELAMAAAAVASLREQQGEGEAALEDLREQLWEAEDRERAEAVRVNPCKMITRREFGWALCAFSLNRGFPCQQGRD
jgi:hypothetical protein